MNFNLKRWINNKRVSLYVKSPGFLAKFGYMKASAISIIIGLIVGAIFIYVTGGDGISFLTNLVTSAFSTEAFGSQKPIIYETLNYFSVFILMGLGLALGFKVGLFNMGGSGQALLGFGLSYYMIKNIADKQAVDINELSHSLVIAVFLIFIVMGVLVSVTTGLLKIFFNIHEVASSIIFNWIIWYMMKWLINENSTTPLDPDWAAIGGYNFIFGLVIAFISVGVIWFVLSYTTFGYKFNVVGKQKSAAKYAGINGNMFIIITTALQGLLISMGGFVYFWTVERTVSFYSDIVPTIGFDAISVSLVAFNNVLGIIPVAFIWAIIQAGSQDASDIAGTKPEIAYLISGIIIYSATIYIIFLKFKPYNYIKEQIILFTNVEFKIFKKDQQLKINALKHELKNVKTQETIKTLEEKQKLKIEQLRSQLMQLEIKNKEYKLSNEYKELSAQLKVELNQLKVETKSKINERKNKLKLEIADLKSIRNLNISELKNNSTDSKELASEIIVTKIKFNDDRLNLISDYVEWLESIKYSVTIKKEEFTLSKYDLEIMEIKTTLKREKLHLEEEIENERIKFRKKIIEIKSDINDVKEKTISMHQLYSFNGLKRIYKDKVKFKSIDILNEAIIELNQIHTHEYASKEEKKEALASINEKYKLQIENLKEYKAQVQIEQKTALENAKNSVKDIKNTLSVNSKELTANKTLNKDEFTKELNDLKLKNQSQIREVMMNYVNV